METTVIDPHGDLMLQVNNERLLVSSRVLALVSPVFEAMLKPNFKEGVAFQMRNPTPPTIPLPEDNIEALRLFCQAIHHRFREAYQLPDPYCLENLAYILDKYQCSGAMAAYGTVWLQREVDNIPLGDLCRLLLFAYVVDLPKQFSSLAAEILTRQKGPFTALPALENHPLMRNDLLESLNVYKQKLSIGLQRAMMRPIAGLVAYQCENVRETVGRYHQNLHRVGASPYEDGFESQSFKQAVKNASRVPLMPFQSCDNYRACSCYSVAPLELKAKLRKEIEAWEKSKQYFCLDCLKTSGTSKKEETCRIAHL